MEVDWKWVRKEIRAEPRNTRDVRFVGAVVSVSSSFLSAVFLDYSITPHFVFQATD